MRVDLHDLVPRARETADDPGPSVKPARGSGADLIGEFEKILRSEMNDLVAVTQEESRLNRDFAAGKVDNVHEVMTAAAKANLAMETAIQIRNLAVRGFQRLTQLR